jgi:LmbE family N-acetylglucosaminyl deacetylase
MVRGPPGAGHNWASDLAPELVGLCDRQRRGTAVTRSASGVGAAYPGRSLLAGAQSPDRPDEDRATKHEKKVSLVPHDFGDRRQFRLLGVFAHPDDETFCAGGTFALHAERGAEIMVLSATRGQAGQIRDPTVGSRRTIGAVREAELRLACERLGVAQVRCLDRMDGTLADADFDSLVAEVVGVIRDFRPDAVITFGPDGGYGHPDHTTISAATTTACQRAGEPGGDREPWPGLAPHRPDGLYYRCFPPADMLLMHRLAMWLTKQPDRFAGTPGFVHALMVMAEETATLGHIRDHAQVRWYPPGSYVVEQGEAAMELFLIMSGHADVWREGDDGGRDQLAHLGPGEFFGELGVAGNRPRAADVVAVESLTCLVLSEAPPTKFAGRGEVARLTRPAPNLLGAPPGPSTHPGTGQAMIELDVTDQIRAKMGALAAYRSQFPLETEMFPDFLLQEIFGREYFIPVPPGGQADIVGLRAVLDDRNTRSSAAVNYPI